MSRSLFTEAVRSRILARIEMGVPLDDAARATGIKPNTCKSWVARGRRESDGPYAAFTEAIENARAEAAARPVPMDGAELALVVSEAARGGSVAAQKLRWEMLKAEPSDEPAAEPGSVIDMLAQQRKRKGRG